MAVILGLTQTPRHGPGRCRKPRGSVGGDGDDRTIVGRAELFEFPGLGGSSAAAAAIDSAGNIVGYAEDAQEISRAVITDGDVLVDLCTRLLHRWRNDTMSEATDINDRGAILVQACCGTSRIPGSEYGSASTRRSQTAHGSAESECFAARCRR